MLHITFKLHQLGGDPVHDKFHQQEINGLQVTVKEGNEPQQDSGRFKGKTRYPVCFYTCEQFP